MMLSLIFSASLTLMAQSGNDSRSNAKEEQSAWPERFSPPPSTSTQNDAPDPWWDALSDEALAELIRRGLENNDALRAQNENAQTQDARSLAQLSPILPSLSAELQGSMAPVNSLGFQFGGIPTGTLDIPEMGVPLEEQFANVSKQKAPLVFFNTSAALRASWSLDLGQSLLNYNAADKDAEAALADASFSEMQIARDVARAYFDAITATQQKAVIDEQIRAGTQLLQLARGRLETGQGSSVDVLQQEQQVASLRASLVPANQQIETAKRQLAWLVGDYNLDIKMADAFPKLAEAALSDPEALANLLPEVRAARLRMEAAHRRTQAAWLGFLPTFGLSAAAGQQSFIVEQTRSQLFWNVGASVSIPIFSSAQNIQNVRINAGNHRVLRAQFESAKRRAVFLVESAQLRVESVLAQLLENRKQIDATSRTLEDSVARFQNGLISFTQILIAQNTAFVTQLQKLALERQRVASQIDLLAALHGNPTSRKAP